MQCLQQDACIQVHKLLYTTIKGLLNGLKVLELAHFADADCYNQAIPYTALSLSWLQFP